MKNPLIAGIDEAPEDITIDLGDRKDLTVSWRGYKGEELRRIFFVSKDGGYDTVAFSEVDALKLRDTLTKLLDEKT